MKAVDFLFVTTLYLGVLVGASAVQAADTDGDGVQDLQDSFPYDPLRSKGNNNVLWAHHASQPVGFVANFGYSVSDAGDVNADGYDDVIVGTHSRGVGNTLSGWAQVLSGLDGSVIHTFLGTSYRHKFGAAVSGAGDVNADGFADVIVGAPLANFVNVYSGQNGQLLYQFVGNNNFFGESVSKAGDVNGDGFADILVGAPGDSVTSGGAAYVYSGQNGSQLLMVQKENQGDYFGYAVSGGSDVNGDGVPDFVVGAYGYGGYSNDRTGAARVFSGVDGTQLHKFVGDIFGDEFGYSVGMAGDVDNDGKTDIVVGAPRNDLRDSDAGLIRIFSGNTGAVLHTFLGDSSGDMFGSTVRGAGDVNGDGFADVLAGSPNDFNEGLGSVRVLSGQDGQILYVFNRSAYVATAGDANGDGFADVVLGYSGERLVSGSAGTVRVFSGNGLATDTDGDGLSDAVDPDDDNDGFGDFLDLFNFNPAVAGDHDKDGLDSLVDHDDDGDGVPDHIDIDPLNPSKKTERNLSLDGIYRGSALKEATTPL